MVDQLCTILFAITDDGTVELAYSQPDVDPALIDSLVIQLLSTTEQMVQEEICLN